MLRAKVKAGKKGNHRFTGLAQITAPIHDEDTMIHHEGHEG